MHFFSEAASELGPPVGDDLEWQTEPCYPRPPEGGGHCLCSDIRKRNCFWPASKTVNDREEVLHALRLRERADQIHVHSQEAARRELTLIHGCMHVSADFGSLAFCTFFAPLYHVSFEVFPNKP